MKKKINVFDHASDIAKALEKGILMTTQHEGKVNTMSIAWGMLGIQWNRPIFIALVRESRFTRRLLDQNGEFTVNVACGEFDKSIIRYCGTHSGKDVDKVRELGLTLEEPVSISVPGIKQLPLTLECKMIYRQKQDLDAIPTKILEKFYPLEAGEMGTRGSRDYHIAYYGEIVNAYMICDK